MSSRHTVFTRYELARYKAQPDNDPNNVLAYSFSPINEPVQSIVAGRYLPPQLERGQLVRFGYNGIDIQKP